MTDIIEVSKKFGIDFEQTTYQLPSGEWKDEMLWTGTLSTSVLQAFADHYRKEDAAEAESKFQRALDARQLQYDRAVKAEEQLAATELVVEQMREALIEMDANHKDWSECCHKVIKALQLQPSLSALRAREEEAYQRGRADEAYDRN